MTVDALPYYDTSAELLPASDMPALIELLNVLMRNEVPGFFLRMANHDDPEDEATFPAGGRRFILTIAPPFDAFARKPWPKDMVAIVIRACVHGSATVSINSDQLMKHLASTERLAVESDITASDLSVPGGVKALLTDPALVNYVVALIKPLALDAFKSSDALREAADDPRNWSLIADGDAIAATICAVIWPEEKAQ